LTTRTREAPALPASPGSPWPALNQAERNALREVLIHGPISRAEIGRRIGMSRASLTRVTRALLDHGLIEEGALEQRARTGRPSEMFGIARSARHFFGVKLTGDAIYAVVTDLGGTGVATHEETLASREIVDVTARIRAIFDAFSARFDDIVAAGVCLGGDLTQDREIVVSAPFLGWTDVPLGRLLTASLGIPVATENDVRALTAAEQWFGAGAGFSSLALITIGAGIGFGFVVDDRLVTGAHGRAGRLDHLRVDAAGPVCAAGHRGCASVYLTRDSIVRAIHGVDTDYHGAVELARAGHLGAARAFRDAGVALGVLIGTVANGLDPEKILLTGDGLAVWELAREHVIASIDDTYDPGPEPLDIDVQPFEFDEWARAAAIVGIRSTLRF